MYDDAVEAVKESVSVEKRSLKGYKEDYTHRKFFISNRPKLHLEDLLKKKFAVKYKPNELRGKPTYRRHKRRKPK